MPVPDRSRDAKCQPGRVRSETGIGTHEDALEGAFDPHVEAAFGAACSCRLHETPHIGVACGPAVCTTLQCQQNAAGAGFLFRRGRWPTDENTLTRRVSPDPLRLYRSPMVTVSIASPGHNCRRRGRRTSSSRTSSRSTN